MMLHGTREPSTWYTSDLFFIRQQKETPRVAALPTVVKLGVESGEGFSHPGQREETFVSKSDVIYFFIHFLNLFCFCFCFKFIFVFVF